MEGEEADGGVGGTDGPPRVSVRRSVAPPGEGGDSLNETEEWAQVGRWRGRKYLKRIMEIWWYMYFVF